MENTKLRRLIVLSLPWTARRCKESTSSLRNLSLHSRTPIQSLALCSTLLYSVVARIKSLIEFSTEGLPHWRLGSPFLATLPCASYIIYYVLYTFHYYAYYYHSYALTLFVDNSLHAFTSLIPTVMILSLFT